MFGEQFYPSPSHVIEQMFAAHNPQGLVCADLQSGKGDIMKALNSHGAARVFGCEIDPNLAKLSSSYGIMLGTDCMMLTSEDVAGIQAFYLNPPFAKARRMIEHLWEIAPEGAVVVAIVNASTIESRRRDSLGYLIETYGYSENIGTPFIQSERPTAVECAMIIIHKPIVSGSLLEGFDLEETVDLQSYGIESHSDVKALVYSVDAAIRKVRGVYAVSQELEDILSPIGIQSRPATLKDEYGNDIYMLDVIRDIQKQAWKKVIEMVDLERYVSTAFKQKIDKFIEIQGKLPLTLRNIRTMVLTVIGTRQGMMDEVIKTLFIDWTRYTHENRYGVPGWKTNESYMLNDKLIINRAMDRWFTVEIDTHTMDKLNDLIKVLCYLKGIKFDTTYNLRYNEGPLYQTNPDKESYERRVKVNYKATNTWYDFLPFFEFKHFKKGTMHLKFKDLGDWALLNREIYRVMGFKEQLPEIISKKTKSQSMHKADKTF